MRQPRLEGAARVRIARPRAALLRFVQLDRERASIEPQQATGLSGRSSLALRIGDEGATRRAEQPGPEVSASPAAELIDSYDRRYEFDFERGILGAPTPSVIAALEHGA